MKRAVLKNIKNSHFTISKSGRERRWEGRARGKKKGRGRGGREEKKGPLGWGKRLSQ